MVRWMRRRLLAASADACRLMPVLAASDTMATSFSPRMNAAGRAAHTRAHRRRLRALCLQRRQERCRARWLAYWEYAPGRATPPPVLAACMAAPAHPSEQLPERIQSRARLCGALCPAALGHRAPKNAASLQLYDLSQLPGWTRRKQPLPGARRFSQQRGHAPVTRQSLPATRQFVGRRGRAPVSRTLSESSSAPSALARSWNTPRPRASATTRPRLRPHVRRGAAVLPSPRCWAPGCTRNRPGLCGRRMTPLRSMLCQHMTPSVAKHRTACVGPPGTSEHL